jgi:hypothetical protein
MGRTREAVVAPGRLWVALAVAAMGFSLVHMLIDFGALVFGSHFGLRQSLLSALIGVLYTWWAWVFANAIWGEKSWLVGLMAFDALWVGANGLTILACLPPCGPVPYYFDTLHLGNLILAPLATYFAYRAMRRISGRGSWFVMVGNSISMLALVIAISALLASLANG